MIAEKLSSGTVLSSAETQKLRLLLRSADVLSSWVGPDGNPKFKKIKTENSAFGVTPNNSTVITAAASVTSGVVSGLGVSSTWSSTSVIIPYSISQTMQFNPIYTNANDVSSFSIIGQANLAGGVAYKLIALMWLKRSDNSFLKYTYLHDRDNDNNFQTIDLVFRPYNCLGAGNNPNDYYFYVIGYQTTGSNQAMSADFIASKLR